MKRGLSSQTRKTFCHAACYHMACCLVAWLVFYAGADAKNFIPERQDFIQQHSTQQRRSQTTRADADFAARPLQGSSPSRPLPKTVRGYKVERVQIKLKGRASKEKVEGGNGKGGSSSDGADDKSRDRNAEGGDDAEAARELIRFGEPRVVSFSLFKIELDFPVEIAAVEQRGRIDRLVFEEITINGVPVEVADYTSAFQLPNNQSLRLPEPLRVTVTTPRALLATFEELRTPKNDWKIVGRIYALGKFNKLFFTFRRAVPIELDLSVPNPIRSERESARRETNFPMRG